MKPSPAPGMASASAICTANVIAVLSAATSASFSAS